MHLDGKHMKKSSPILQSGLLLLALLGAATPAWAQLVINDTLTGASSSYQWKSLNGACLTAGDGTGSIPACAGLPYYSGKTLVGGTTGRLPDVVGKGALRLTNGDTTLNGSNGDNQTGAVVSNFTFPTNEGLQVTFSTVTYGGDGNNGTGADGISFFLSDGSQDPTVGALGGSLGYSCSNVNGTYDGVIGAYIGVGIDEYGNFDNNVDNTDTDDGSPKNGNQLRPGRITLRGAGSTAYDYLSQHPDYKQYYPASLKNNNSLRSEAIRNTCRTGMIWNYSGGKLHGYDNKTQTNIRLDYNYRMLQSVGLPSGVTISNQQGVNNPLRDLATPITYGLKITQDGLMDFSYSVNGGAPQTVISQRPITESNGPLPSSFRFGFSSGTGGSNNVHEITCFKAAPVNQSNSSAGTNVQQSSRVQAGSQVYLAYYHPTNWWGELTAQDVLYNAETDTLSVNPVANWNASCVLTGGKCQATGSTADAAAQAPGSRSMLTWNTTTNAGVPFQWNSISQAQRNALASGDSSSTDIRLRYLRGDRSDEINTSGGGKLRVRNGVLGDIYNSSPSWVGPPTLAYDGPWVDTLIASASPAEGATGSQTYTQFKTDRQTRQNVVYVGANDGFLHGFRSGSYDINGKPVTDDPTNDGREVLAYMPSSILQAIHPSTASLDFSSTQYSHNFYVDATPGTGDLFYGKEWHTWLVGGTGAGGRADGPIADKTSTGKGSIFVLDITDPSTFSEANSAAIVKGEWSSDSLTCDGVADCGKNLGNTYGTPIIRRLHNGKWAALFGNGFNSATGKAGLFVMIVDPDDGRVGFRYIDTGYGPERDPAKTANTDGTKNGIAYVTSADLDGDHITDYVYAGDVFGNLWRFDLTSANPGEWSASSAPLFSTPVGQPITSRVTVSAVDGVGPRGQVGVIVGFGTGQQLPQTATSAAKYASGAQALYGIWDWNLANWNSKASASAQYAVLPTPQTVTASALQTQTTSSIGGGSGTVSDYRTITANNICWKGSQNCTGGTTANNKFGWTVPLPTDTEQVVFNPTTSYGMFIVNTTIPSVNQALTCDTKPAAGYTMAVSIATGGAPPKSSFFADRNGSFDNGVIAGIGLGGTGTVSTVSTGDSTAPWGVTQTGDGSPATIKLNPKSTEVGGRLTWIKRR